MKSFHLSGRFQNMDIWKKHQQPQVFQKPAVRRGTQISGLAPLGVPCHLTMDITISYLREEQEHVCATASLPSDTYWLRAWKKDVLEKGGIKGLPTASSNFNWHQKKKGFMCGSNQTLEEINKWKGSLNWMLLLEMKCIQPAPGRENIYASEEWGDISF